MKEGEGEGEGEKLASSSEASLSGANSGELLSLSFLLHVRESPEKKERASAKDCNVDNFRDLYSGQLLLFASEQARFN